MRAARRSILTLAACACAVLVCSLEFEDDSEIFTFNPKDPHVPRFAAMDRDEFVMYCSTITWQDEIQNFRFVAYGATYFVTLRMNDGVCESTQAQVRIQEGPSEVAKWATEVLLTKPAASAGFATLSEEDLKADPDSITVADFQYESLEDINTRRWLHADVTASISLYKQQDGYASVYDMHLPSCADAVAVATKFLRENNIEDTTPEELVDIVEKQWTVLPPQFNINRPIQRFIPDTLAQIYQSVYVHWDILDAYMRRYHPNQGMYGYMRPMQMDRYLESVIAHPNPLVCEIGMNGGHSAVAFLVANPQSTVMSFEMGDLKYTPPIVEHLETVFTKKRFIYREGDSKITVPSMNSEARKCDFVFIDGDHTAEGVFADIKNMKQHSHCDTLVFLDDIVPAKRDPGATKAYKRALERGILEEIERPQYHMNSYPHNPCMRMPDVQAESCRGAWGHAIARYSLDGCLHGV